MTKSGIGGASPALQDLLGVLGDFWGYIFLRKSA
jgi:hypothetical protein